MHRKLTLFILLTFVALLPAEAIALPGAAWSGKKVRVFVHTIPEMRPLIHDMLPVVYQGLPDRGPRLIYREAKAQSCQSRKARRTLAIAICSAPSVIHGGVDVPGRTTFRQQRHRFIWARVELSNTHFFRDPARFRNTLCHELWHAVTGIPDHNGPPDDAESCVWGVKDSPGTTDTAYGNRVYKKYGDHHSGPRRGGKRD